MRFEEIMSAQPSAPFGPPPPWGPPASARQGLSDVAYDTPTFGPRVAERLGDTLATSGFQPVPDVLLFYQKELGLRSEDLNVLLQIFVHWYRADQMPFPRGTTIAKRMGVSPRSVQRSISRLRQEGFLGKTRNPDGRTAHDMKPLVAKLEPYAKRRIATRKELQSAAGIAA